MLLLSHVGKTDEIKDFVITEESSIAKGIRRIVAVTGQEAHEASRGASEFSKRLDWIDTLTGKEKDAQLKPYLAVSSRHAIRAAFWSLMFPCNFTGTRSARHVGGQEEPTA